MNLKPLLKFVVVCLVLASTFFAARAGSYDDFFRAVEQDDARAISSLLQRGFDPNTRDPKGQVALFVALRSGSTRAAEALWAHPGLQFDAANAAGETPLMMAALRGNLEWTRKLMSRGSAVHREGWSPVHYAATGPESTVVRVLLDAGAPVNARSPNGTTPLMMAARYGPESSVDLLLARGGDLRLRSQQGANAADFARMEGRSSLAARLDSLVR